MDKHQVRRVRYYLKEIRKSDSLFIMEVAFLSMVSCLLSSHVPLPFLDAVLKFVEVHQVFLKHELPHDNKLGDSNRCTTWPFSRLFSCREVCQRRIRGVFFGSKNLNDICYSLKQNKQQYLFGVHYLTELCMECRMSNAQLL